MPIVARRIALALLFAGGPAIAAAQTAANVALVINTNSKDSLEIGEYYSKARRLPSDNVIRIESKTTEGVSPAEYSNTIEVPINRWLVAHSLQDRILYLVLTKGVPIRIDGTPGPEGSTASVDSELSLLYRRLVGEPTPTIGHVPNPYYLGERPAAEARPFLRKEYDIFLVSRLDGFSTADVLKLIERGLKPSSDGKFILDERATLLDSGGDRWLQQAAERIKAVAGDRVVLEATKAIATADGPVLGYYSWGSNDAANRLRKTGLQFAPGAIGGMFVSTDGRTFAEPPADWSPIVGSSRGGFFMAGSQSLAGDLIRDGLTGVSAHVAEPFLDATIRPQILFPAYLSGFNLVESFYLAMPYLSWQTVVIGDPLCSIVSRPSLPAMDLDAGVNTEADQPAIFADRRLKLTSRVGLKSDAVVLMMRVDAQTARDPKADVEPLLVKATELEPKLTVVQARLAGIYEERSNYDKAAERYRKILDVEPKNALALNNLAYFLATRKKAPSEALPFAERALRAASTPDILDTLGWIHHLLGDDRTAAVHLERAIDMTESNSEILFHAAVVHGQLKDFPRAKRELQAAEKLDPTLKDQGEVKALKKLIGM